ncbi:MAG: phenylalanine--tRNA ligase subunit alpha [Thermoleophilia bacterium]|nr:phenylalanine--tRNA ligase subunit alpha [Thermoleophilia bacterium]
MSGIPDLTALADEAVAQISSASDLDALEAARVKYLGRKAPLTELLGSIGTLPPEERGRVGKDGNAARKAIEAALDARREGLEADAMGAALEADTADVTLPGNAFPLGALHPITQVRLEVEEIFLGMGYSVADGPEVETGYNNFTALNTPDGHPARSESDTFFIGGGDDVLLRTQTSPVQIRTMQQGPPPVYVIAPGTVYRRDDVDATHSPMFHQVEGLAVDEGLSFAHLKGTIEYFLTRLLGDRDVRVIPHFFPFTEPSVDVSVSWTDRHGRTDWLEVAGAGMVDPNVFAAVGYDPERWTGFAFGFGLDRIAMIRHQISDIRLLYEGDLRFLEQFS